MAQEGYWAVCEEISPESGDKKKPSMCMVTIDDFFYATVMASSRLEALMRAQKKLKENIRFLQVCAVDVPVPGRSDSPPPQQLSEGKVRMFIPLEALGLAPESIQPLAA